MRLLSFSSISENFILKTVYIFSTQKYMKQNSFIHKSALVLLVVLAITITNGQTRNLQWSDNYCNKFDATGACVKCSHRYYKNCDTGMCTQVSDFCQTFSPSNGDCLSCYQGYGTPVNGKCSAAPVNDDGNVVGSTDIDPNCKCFTDYRVCNACYEGYYLDTTDYTCVPKGVSLPPVDHCNSYGYLDNAGKKWGHWNNGCKKVCTSCIDGYYLDCNHTCQLLPAHCDAADQKGICTDCSDNYEYDTTSNMCVLIVGNPDDKNCLDYGYVDKKGFYLTKWSQGCKYVCVQCAEDYYLNQYHKCTLLPSHCDQAYQNGTCKTCSSGYEFDQSYNCVAIVGTADYCYEYSFVDVRGKWALKWSSGCKEVCIDCIDGYYLDKDNKCNPLPDNCDQADQNGTCTDCSDGYKLNSNNVCVVSGGNSDHCVDYDYEDIRGKRAAKWFKGCNKVCTACEDNYYLNKYNKCIPFPDNCDQVNENGTCKACSDNYEFNDSGDCVLIVSTPGDHCTNYSYTDSWGKSNSAWFKGCRKVCTACEDFYYLNKYNTCKPYPANCAQVDENGVCTNCSAGYSFNDTGDCVLIVSSGDHCIDYEYADNWGKRNKFWAHGCKKVCTACEDYYFLNSQNKCQAYPDNCDSVDQNGTCTNCSSGYIFDDNGACVLASSGDHCIDYEYADNWGKRNKFWAHGCKKVCTACEDYYFLNSQNKCQAYPDNCDSVDQNGTCTNCSSGYIFDDNGACVLASSGDHCIDYEYADNWGKRNKFWAHGCKKVCVACCKGYQLNDQNICVACAPPARVADPLCVTYSDDGSCDVCSYRSVRMSGGRCKKVDEQCLTYNATSGLCTSCYGGYTLTGGCCVA